MAARGARAQLAMPVIGFLSTTSAGPFAHLIAGFRRACKKSAISMAATLSLRSLGGGPVLPGASAGT